MGVNTGTGRNTKCGISGSISDGGTEVITFTKSFGNTPCIILTQGSGSKEHVLTATSVTTTSFTISVIKGHTGGSDSITVYWLACDEMDL